MGEIAAYLLNNIALNTGDLVSFSFFTGISSLCLDFKHFSESMGEINGSGGEQKPLSGFRA